MQAGNFAFKKLPDDPPVLKYIFPEFIEPGPAPLKCRNSSRNRKYIRFGNFIGIKCPPHLVTQERILYTYSCSLHSRDIECFRGSNALYADIGALMVTVIIYGLYVYKAPSAAEQYQKMLEEKKKGENRSGRERANAPSFFTGWTSRARACCSTPRRPRSRRRS